MAERESGGIYLFETYKIMV
ncbi:hypothetical protein [Halobacillus naozhouensis]